MNDTLAMRAIERRGDLDSTAQCLIERQWSPRPPLRERFAVEQLHHAGRTLIALAVEAAVGGAPYLPIPPAPRRSMMEYGPRRVPGLSALIGDPHCVTEPRKVCGADERIVFANRCDGSGCRPQIRFAITYRVRHGALARHQDQLVDVEGFRQNPADALEKLAAQKSW